MPWCCYNEAGGSQSIPLSTLYIINLFATYLWLQYLAKASIALYPIPYSNITTAMNAAAQCIQSVFSIELLLLSIATYIIQIV